MAFTLNTFGLGVCCYLELWILMAWAGLFDETDICQGMTFEPECPYNEVLKIETARYGRMELGSCANIDMGYIGCQKDVLLLADTKCSGRRTCEISIPDSDFDNTEPCYELKSYLRVSYSCLKVLNEDSRICDDAQHLRAPDQQGYITRTSRGDSGAAWCDDGEKPWLIEALPGQRINVTLIDFSVNANTYSGPGFSNEHGGVEVCQKYFTVEETSGQRETDICGGRQREEQVYLSNSNRLLIHFNIQPEAADYHFMIFYEIIGCQDPALDPGMHTKRENDFITIGCHNSDQTWKLICEGTTWVGDHQNCSNKPGDFGSITGGVTGHLSRRAVIGILCAIAVVVAVLFILLGALIYRRWQKREINQMVEVPTISPISSPMKKYSCPEAEFIEDEDEVYLKPAPNFYPHHHHHHHHSHHHHHHAQPDDPLKPLPLPNKTNDYTERRNKKTDAGSPLKATDMKITKSKNDYTHVWEMPLPTPGEG